VPYTVCIDKKISTGVVRIKSPITTVESKAALEKELATMLSCEVRKRVEWCRVEVNLDP
jgi:hypothetical protein